MNTTWVKDNKKALVWLERMKAQALVDSIKNKFKSEYSNLMTTTSNSSIYQNLVRFLD